MPFPIVFQKQAVMRKVVAALIPPFLGSVYFFGWRSAAVVLVSLVTSVLAEWAFLRKKKGRVSEAVLVTSFLFGLILPPTIPLTMVVLGAAFAVTFGKMAFGGFGANVFNPAMVGRAFLYITFPVHMTARWVPAANFSDFPGGFSVWRFIPSGHLDALTTATPSHAYRAGAETLPSVLQLFLGNINGQFEKLGETVFIGGGSIGETSALLLLAGGLYLLFKKVAKWRLVVSFFSTYLIVQSILHAFVPDLVPGLFYGILSGGAILGGFFMVTDPVSGAKTKGGQWIYGGLIALSTNIIRSFSLFAGGLMFSILLGNMFAPLIDTAVDNTGRKKR
ncbi:MAG TPA: RnfABCDGE type electron transport complex subunit D [bacterium]|nr:RnfABCDGE type electron transport complex subunit D [bacterium]